MPHESELCCFLLLLNIFFVCIIYKVTDFVGISSMVLIFTRIYSNL